MISELPAVLGLLGLALIFSRVFLRLFRMWMVRSYLWLGISHAASLLALLLVVVGVIRGGPFDELRALTGCFAVQVAIAAFDMWRLRRQWSEIQAVQRLHSRFHKGMQPKVGQRR